ncbi:MAG TPA: DMT family transporter [Candidatus Polarisedimenticolia bacterium]|nr:DMT family transporter [Candidatus Polarisedimenticolia bacterium]
MDRGRAIGIGLVLVSACAFGSGGLIAKPVYAEGVGWHTLMVWRFVVGAALAWAWLLGSPSRRAALRRVDRRAIVVALALGVLYTGNSATYFAGLETVPVSLAALIVYVYPALVAVLSLRVGQALTGIRAWAALGLALVGVALAVGSMPASDEVDGVGLILIAASPVIYAVWIVLAARLSGERRTTVGEATTGGLEPAAASALMMSATAMSYVVGAIALGQPMLPSEVPGSVQPAMLAIGLVSTFVAIQTFYAGARRIGAAQASLLSTIEPIWTISLAALFLAESLTLVQLIGGALILGGVVLAQTGPGSNATARELRLADE